MVISSIGQVVDVTADVGHFVVAVGGILETDAEVTGTPCVWEMSHDGES